MKAKNHIILNIIILYLVKNIYNFYFFNNINWNILLFISIFTCLLPDIDHGNSTISRKFKIISKIISFSIGHRKLTHSLLFLIILYIFFRYFNLLNNIIFISIIIGCLNHILSDMLTKNGVKFLWPLNLKFKITYKILLLLIILYYINLKLNIILLN